MVFSSSDTLHRCSITLDVVISAFQCPALATFTPTYTLLIHAIETCLAWVWLYLLYLLASILLLLG